MATPQTDTPAATAERVAERRQFIERLTGELAPLSKARAEAGWALATGGGEDESAALANASVALERAMGDPEQYLTVRRLVSEDAPKGEDPAVARSLALVEKWMLARQGEAKKREEIVSKEAELRRTYGTFRGTIDGTPHSGVELERILAESEDDALRKKAWEATKQVGEVVRPAVIELVKLRNEVARSQGFRDHYAMALELSELSEDRLFTTLGKLEKATRTPFRTRKAVYDAERARDLGVDIEAIQPWHYTNPFFQSVHVPESLSLDPVYESSDLEAVATRFFDGLGMNVRGVLAASDLYPREGKDEHAFCMHVDRKQDVRVLANLRPSERWMSTLLHELGHAAYDRYIDQPWLLSRPAHTLVTEAVAMLMGRQSVDLEFLLEYLELPAIKVTPLSGEIRRFQCFRMQAFTRWVLVMTHFERDLYADPDREDLDDRWWELKKKYQLVERPEGRTGADWAAKRHLALAPVYYQNYMYGELLASQLRHVIIERARTNSIVDSLYAGELLIQELFRHGSLHRWDSLVERATGEPLNPDHFVREFTA